MNSFYNNVVSSANTTTQAKFLKKPLNQGTSSAAKSMLNMSFQGRNQKSQLHVPVS